MSAPPTTSDLASHARTHEPSEAPESPNPTH